jgi:hypothetical protein
LSLGLSLREVLLSRYAFILQAIGTRLQIPIAIGILGFMFFNLFTIELLLSFACPKESNKRKRQPQIPIAIGI